MFGYDDDPLGLGQYASLLPASRLPGLPGAMPLPSAPALPNPATQPFDPGTEDTMLQKILGTVSGPLGYIGGSLGKAFGGRAIRGALGGNVREMASVLPFSDALGITDPSQEVHGEDLLKQWGVLQGDGEKGTFEMRDLAGPALEALLDPGTYMTFGASALTDAGRAAKAAGSLEKTMAGRIAAGQGGLVGFGLPFAHPSAILGSGQSGTNVLNGLSDANDWLRQTIPGYGKGADALGTVRRNLGALFDRRVEGTTSAALQPELRTFYDQLPQARAEAVDPLVKTWQNAQQAGLMTPQDLSLVRAIREGTASPLPNTTAGKAMNDQVESLKQIFADRLVPEAAAGAPTPTMQDYYPRQMTPADGDAKAASVAAFNRQPGSPFNVHQLGREPHMDNAGMIGATQGFNALFADPGARALIQPGNPLALQQFIRGNYLKGSTGLGWSAADEAERIRLNTLADQGRPLTAAESASRQTLNSQWAQAEGLAGALPGINPAYAEKGLPFFGNDPYTDAMSRITRGVESQGRLEAVTRALAKNATLGGDGVRATDVLDKLGATPQARVALAGQMGLTDPTQVLGATVHPDIANDLSGMVQRFNKPEATSGLLSLIDQATNLTRAGISGVWPARYVRDFTQGIANNAFHDLPISQMPKAYRDANTLVRRGQNLPDANTFAGLTHLTNEDANRQLAREMFSYQVAGPNRFTASMESGARTLGQQAPTFTGPMTPQPTLGKILKGAVDFSDEGSMKPWAIAGVGGRKETAFAPLKAGGEAEDLIDDLGRGAMYLQKRREGFVPAAAAQAATKAQYDYGNLSQFERSVMRRVFPFYNWSRQNVPAVLSELSQRPGGLMAQAAKGTVAMRHDQGFVPGYIGEGMAMPVGQEDDGQQRFLSGLDLPYEDLLPLGTGPHAAQRTIEKLLGEANPLLKAPLQAATGTQFDTGRPLNTMYGSSGNSVLDQLLYEGPASRAITTARTIGDYQRKGISGELLNLLSPARINDVDLDKQRQIAGRQAVEDYLGGNPNVHNFERLYVRPDQVPNLSPADLSLMRLYSTLEQQAKKKPAGR